MRRLKNTLIYCGVSFFLTHAYVNYLTDADRLWLRTVTRQVIGDAFMAFGDVISMIAAALASGLLALLWTMWAAFAPYIVATAIALLIIATGLGIYVHALNTRDQTDIEIQHNIERLKRL